MKRNPYRISEELLAGVDLGEVISALREQRAAIDKLIAAVELLAVNQPKRKARLRKRVRLEREQQRTENVIVFAARDIA